MSPSRCESGSAVGQERLVLGQCEGRRDTGAAPAAPGQGIIWLAWEQELPSLQYQLSGENMCAHKTSSLLYSNYYTEMILSVTKAAEPQISGALAEHSACLGTHWFCLAGECSCPTLPGKVTGSLQGPLGSSTATNVSNFPLEIVSVNILISFGLSRWSEDNTS